jgi:hypothetical protein
MKRFELVKREDHYGLYNEDGHKIAATIDGCNSKLSIKNCESIANGYDLDELAKNIKTEDGFEHKQSFISGFQKALEILGDKKFSEKDVRDAYYHGEQDSYMKGGLTKQKEDEYIQSLQQTEFEVEIVMGTLCRQIDCVDDARLIESKIVWGKEDPMLDKNGCLILRKL